MMSQSVLDHAEFCLPADKPNSVAMDQQQLRAAFDLPQATNYAAKEGDDVDAIILGIDLHTEGMAEVKLKSYLSPEPLAMQNDRLHIPTEVLANCSLTTRARVESGQQRLAQSLPHDEAQLYQVLQQVTAQRLNGSTASQ